MAAGLLLPISAAGLLNRALALGGMALHRLPERLLYLSCFALLTMPLFAPLVHLACPEYGMGPTQPRPCGAGSAYPGGGPDGLLGLLGGGLGGVCGEATSSLLDFFSRPPSDLGVDSTPLSPLLRRRLLVRDLLLSFSLLLDLLRCRLFERDPGARGGLFEDEAAAGDPPSWPSFTSTRLSGSL